MIRKTNTYMQPGQQNNALQSLQTLKIIPKSATFFCFFDWSQFDDSMQKRTIVSCLVLGCYQNLQM